MSHISSVTSYMPPSTALKSIPSNYDTYHQAYGPVVANVAGVAASVGDAASAVVNFSAESLSKLSELADDGVDAVGGAFSDVGSAIGDAVNSVGNGLSELYTDMSDLALSGVDTISETASAVADGFSEVADSVSDATSSVVDGIGSAANSVAGYAALGAIAAKQALSELA